MPASPPEQLMEAIFLCANGPNRLNSFKVSKNSGTVLTRAIPKRVNNASKRLSAPVRELVWDSAILAAAGVRPVLIATMGILRDKARRAAASKATKSGMPSMCKPMALTRGSSNMASITLAMST